MSTSPYVTIGASYGSAPSFSAGSGSVTAGTNTTLVTSPIAQACFGCHTSQAAVDHINVAGRIYTARGTGFNASAFREGCLDCHGSGKTFGIDQVHRLP
jgi:mono/diheme cytochrome c family protein